MHNIKCVHFIGNESDINKFKWGGNPDGSIDVYDNYIEVFTKSKIVAGMFGAIGSAIEGKGKSDYRVNRSDIVSYTINNDRFIMKLNDGRVFFVNARNDKQPLIDFLQKPAYEKPKQTYSAPKVSPIETEKTVVPPYTKSEFSLGKEQKTTYSDLKFDQPKPQPKPEPKPQPKEDPMIAQLTALKQLLDAGILTQEEFDFKKKQILGMNTEAPKAKKYSDEDLLKIAFQSIPTLENLMKESSYEFACQEMRKYKNYFQTRYYFKDGKQVPSDFTGEGLIVGPTFVYYGDIKKGMRHGEGENILVEDINSTIITGYFINNELYGPCTLERHTPQSNGFLVKKDIGTFFKNMYNGNFIYDIQWADSNHFTYEGSAVNGKLTLIDNPNLKYPVGYDKEHDQVFGYNSLDFVNNAIVTLE